MLGKKVYESHFIGQNSTQVLLLKMYGCERVVDYTAHQTSGRTDELYSRRKLSTVENDMVHNIFEVQKSAQACSVKRQKSHARWQSRGS